MTDQLQINLSPQIRDAHREAVQIAEHARGYASNAVEKAVECGQLLIRQKTSLGHGSWLEWVSNNLPDISYETLARYMRVAKAVIPRPAANSDSNLSPVTNLENAQTLKQAYVALGILPPPEDKSSQPPDPNKPWVRYTKPLNTFRRWFNTRVEDEPLDKWDEDMLRILSNELLWFANLHTEMKQRLAALAGGERQ